MSDAAFYRGRRVLVTGARGFLGAHVCAALAETGADVIAVGRREADLTDQAAVRALMVSTRPSWVMHLAAACGGIAANVENPGRFVHDNALMGLLVLEEARQAGAEGWTLVSTTCAYPAEAPLPLAEDAIWQGPPVAATGPYGIAKRMLHAALDGYRAQHGFEGVCLIPANLYGPGDHMAPDRSHVVAALVRRFVEAAEARAPVVTCWGTGAATRELLHVRDAAAGIVALTARHRGGGAVNLGTGVETSIRALAEQIAAAAGFEGRIVWDATKPEGQARRVLDVRRATALGWRAAVGLDAGIAELVAWWRAARPGPPGSSARCRPG
ncbi:MAG: NAD-dependent epimerase/dehydratase family protein [Myxococcales bacterium]|nr:NAD-dependent epimerase/dehydratase family protein [Myxococcales bacterium]